MRILYILFSHSVFIAAGVFAQQYQTEITHQLAVPAKTNWLFILAALSFYNLYYWLSLRLKQPASNSASFFNGPSHWWTALISGIMATFLFFSQTVNIPVFVLITLCSALYVGLVFSKCGRPDSHPVCRFLKMVLLAWVWWLTVFFYPLCLADIPVNLSLGWDACFRFCSLMLVCMIYDCKDGLLLGHARLWRSLFMAVAGLLLVSGMMVSANPEQCLLTIIVAVISVCLFLVPRHPKGFWFYAFWSDGLLLLPVLLQRVMSI
ncbi:MAG: hypothetical protein ACKO5C_02455 [Ferruginibacter sp.]